MDPLSKKLFEELEEMQHHAGRMLRNMSFARSPFESCGSLPAVNIYESETEISAIFDLAGVVADSLTVMAEVDKIRVSGKRELPINKSLVCIHQLEIEGGCFDRTITLPSAIETKDVTTTFKNGILAITMPKKMRNKKIRINVTTLGETA